MIKNPPDFFPLEARVFLYAILSASLRSEPSAEFLRELIIRISSLKSDMAGRLEPTLRRSVNELFKALPYATPEALAVDYASLFLSGKKGCLASSESAYLEKILYGQSTLNVTARYAEFGFVKESSFTEPNDHIAIECAFMAALGMELVEHASTGNWAEVNHLVDAQSSFIEFHIGRWVPDWAEKLKEIAGTGFYKAVAKLASCLIAADRELLASLSG